MKRVTFTVYFIINILENKKISILFQLQFIKIFSNYIKFLKNLNSKKYIFKEHYLKFTDIIFCLNHLFEKINFRTYKNYHGINLDPIIHRELNIIQIIYQYSNL